eukprot:Trichotokara_eunicae@DN4482_c0_g1_i1.p1
MTPLQDLNPQEGGNGAEETSSAGSKEGNGAEETSSPGSKEEDEEAPLEDETPPAREYMTDRRSRINVGAQFQIEVPMFRGTERPALPSHLGGSLPAALASTQRAPLSKEENPPPKRERGSEVETATKKRIMTRSRLSASKAGEGTTSKQSEEK